MTDLDAFRAEARAWLEANCPAECRGPVESDEDRVWGGRNAVFPTPAHKVWLDRMGAKGWTAPEWPTEYGGGGLSREQAKVLGSEMRRIDAQAPLASFGVWMLGPALLAFGTEEQKQRFLPEIVRGEIRWCQGYSEPGAGSDLASIQTRAEDRGDHWIVNGQKVWTSYADKADWIFCLVRTDPEAPKHLGISFVLFDMATKGVSTRPITLISGKSPFCETFFDDVRVEKANLVGTLNRGWDVAKALLAHERTMIGAMGEVGGGRPLGQVATGSIGVDDEGRLDEPMLRARIAEMEVDAAAFRLAMERAGDQVKAGQAHPAIASMLKYYGSELNKRRHELLMAAGGSDALEWESERSRGGKAAREWLRTKANSIEGGTSEVQLNIIAKHLLQLPGA
ncbi:MAG: acyl-CoA dehydrogenase family protein [Brevundimonas sp.]|uniref:acyl-CoA dehydrogenase family protein n=1 Tax=Brevundimonas sp. TaxID=1871086 RepID=UPI0027188801|nr:acyl-CoA dehydrogenase family protein [Brevundimonas sp.]MDO9076421.1 acyl-CoA dehydrogenase family protein [Brevundimonas sp.]MDP3081330.1 acyl-CoA dehydrogenase family protein [Brevundimonas sp.]MDZ4060875.1 acyl-CoA dehydrogenase family protein [Brevundimonas sp.]